MLQLGVDRAALHHSGNERAVGQHVLGQLHRLARERLSAPTPGCASAPTSQSDGPLASAAGFQKPVSMTLTVTLMFASASARVDRLGQGWSRPVSSGSVAGHGRPDPGGRDMEVVVRGDHALAELLVEHVQGREEPPDVGEVGWKESSARRAPRSPTTESRRAPSESTSRSPAVRAEGVVHPADIGVVAEHDAGDEQVVVGRRRPRCPRPRHRRRPTPHAWGRGSAGPGPAPAGGRRPARCLPGSVPSKPPRAERCDVGRSTKVAPLGVRREGPAMSLAPAGARRRSGVGVSCWGWPSPTRTAPRWRPRSCSRPRPTRGCSRSPGRLGESCCRRSRLRSTGPSWSSRTAVQLAVRSGDADRAADARASLGLSLIIAGQTRAGLGQLRRALDSASDPTVTARILTRRGHARYFLLARPAEALDDLEAALRTSVPQASRSGWPGH